MNPFEIVDVINLKGAHDRDEVVSDYSAYLINRKLSHTLDSLLFAAEMNRMSHLPAKAQFDFYYHGIPKGKRFSEWYKEDTSEESLINTLCKWLCVNRTVAKRYLAMLSEEQKREILKMEGGT